MWHCQFDVSPVNYSDSEKKWMISFRLPTFSQTWPRGYKRYFKLNSYLSSGWTEKKSQEKKSRKKSHGKKVTGNKVTGKKVTIIKDQMKIHVSVHKYSRTCFSC